jgi:L-asparaginase
LREILIINTGGTFNKIYNRFNGELEIDSTNKALKTLEQEWLCSLNYINIINKDSLEFTQSDRELLSHTIHEAKEQKIVVIHGTDTIDISAKFIDEQNFQKAIVFTGAMVPFSINPIEASANLSLALGFVKLANIGVYIALNGVVDSYTKVVKNRAKGKFTLA